MKARRPAVRPGLLLAPLALISGSVSAFDWSYEADLNLSGEYNTNILLTALPHKDVWGTLLGANLDVSAKSEPWFAHGRIRILDARYFGQQGLDTTNVYAHVDGYYDLTERSRLALTGKYILDSNLSGIAEGQGLVARRLRRSTAEIGPSWTYSLTERSELELSYRYTDLSYDTSDLNALSRVVDWHTHTGTLDFRYQLTEITLMNAGVQVMDYFADPAESIEFASAPVEHVFVNALVGVAHEIAPTWRLGLSAGGQFIQSDRPGRFNDSAPLRKLGFSVSGNQSLRTGYLVDAYVQKDFDSGQLRAEYSRGIKPSIFGDLQEKNRVSLMGRYSFSRKLSAGLRFDYLEFRNRNAAGLEISGNRINRDVYRMDTDLLWNWTEAISLQAAYRYIHQTRERISGVQFGHRILLTLRYHWDKTSI